MTVLTWTEKDFEVFEVEGLAPRMEALIANVRPKFEEFGSIFSTYFTAELNEEFFPHVAKHARRKTNPPNDSWVAFAPYKRGYKAMPHFQIGLFDTHMFVNLAVIYEAPNKEKIAETLLKKKNILKDLPADFYISGDHMSPKTDLIHPALKDGLAEKLITRFRDVKKGELIIGLKVMREDAVQLSSDELSALIERTFEALLPLYKTMVSVNK
ncbi:UPF0637 protein [Kurthia zopfii]|uniref:UPF0637 protein DFR61_12234 n=1 Tax=Kurthia zopfii TaxID=1650 RepID=A0A2U3ABW9_9BACL|nr:DUF1054 domain-containing protein [Kurthia zopfii]PWI22054.1 DUF1054 domain-containing protein [Kurthia zopfii]TDR36950.1 uncharacterized protein YktB (UPF0637 family) [Kurthia zopfii]STX08957.1 Uncharacterized protein conserved in bacteria [Kurthia zopfii]VEI04831.1 Uncharacterized protein conserved in bacteria [Kurthia zopfii]GEK31175.1 UPF0637 protein [Kurthia zopfii]